MKAMILAAGGGTRLSPLTDTCPKPMLPVSGRPALEYIIAWLNEHGIREIGVNLHHLGGMIREHFGDGGAFGVTLTYSEEPELMGTAGGIKRLADFFDERFAVAYGDVLTDLDLGAMMAYHESRCTAGPYLTMSLQYREDPTAASIVAMDAEGRITRFVEKPKPEEVFSHWVSAGVVIAEPGILDYVPPDTVYDFGFDLFPRLLAEGVPMFGWKLPEGTYLVDFGTPEQYERVQREWPV